jgi:hypothetical protein
VAAGFGNWMLGDDRAQPRYRLLTTLLDAQTWPAQELATLYHRRWEVPRSAQLGSGAFRARATATPTPVVPRAAGLQRHAARGPHRGQAIAFHGQAPELSVRPHDRRAATRVPIATTPALLPPRNPATRRRRPSDPESLLWSIKHLGGSLLQSKSSETGPRRPPEASYGSSYL